MERLTSSTAGVAPVVGWDLRVPGSDVFGCAAVADAVAHAGDMQRVRADVLQQQATHVAAYPADVSRQFDAADSRLVRSLQ